MRGMHLLMVGFAGVVVAAIAAGVLMMEEHTSAEDENTNVTAQVMCQDGGGVVQVAMSGTWHNSCTPQNPLMRVTGVDIYFMLSYASPSAICLQVLTPWSESATTAPLPDGSYRVYITPRAGTPRLEATVQVACHGDEHASRALSLRSTGHT